MRKLAEIRAAEKEYCSKVWYGRTQQYLHDIQHHGEPMPPEDIFDGMMAECHRLEAKYGQHEIDVADEYEWAELHGKLSALRWILGSEWGDLDT